MAYHRFTNDLGEEYGSFETFYHEATAEQEEYSDDNEDFFPSGWYWHACFPGCLPDGEPNGPFATEQGAIDDARNNS